MTALDSLTKKYGVHSVKLATQGFMYSYGLVVYDAKEATFASKYEENDGEGAGIMIFNKLGEINEF